MLSKLLKYEIKATARIFLPLYLVLLVFAGINLLISSLSPDIGTAPSVISMTLYITIMVGILVMTFIVMIQRFYKNLLSDEGYLMFTLPTKPWKHIVSKLLVSMMWTLVSGLIAVLSIFIIAFNKISIPVLFRDLLEICAQAYEALGASVYLFAFEIILVAFISLASGVLIIYASIAIGHLFNQHKVLASLGAFIGLNTLTQILFVMVGSLPIISDLSMNSFTLAMQSSIHLIIWLFIIFTGIIAFGYFVTTNIILSKRLNLE